MARPPKPNARQLCCEHLEDRRMLTVVTVDTIEDVVDFNDGVTSLREAIARANDRIGIDEIVFDLGNQLRSTIRLTEGELEITDVVTITGPGPTLLTIDASGNDPTPDSTYDDGDDSNDGDGSRIFSFDVDRRRNETFSTLEGLTLTGGDVDSGSAISAYGNIVLRGVVVSENSGVAIDASGTFRMEQSTVSANSAGGVRAEGVVTVSDSVITGNSGGYLVGGIYLYGSYNYESTISNSFITNNSQVGNGGGIAASGMLSIVSSTISSNSGRDTGGGVYLRSGELEVRDSNITNNSTTHYGGGIGVRFGSLVISGSDISRNSSGVFGGGISTRLPATIVSSTITNNSSGFGGGGIRTTSELNVTDSKITGNSSEFGSGGGVLTYGASTFLRSTISGNSSERDGGGIWSQSRTLEGLVLSDSTISDNSASRDGGGAWVTGGAVFRNTSIARNSAEGSGGGLALQRSATTIVGGRLERNAVNSQGGAIRVEYSRLQVHSVEVFGNRSRASGGAISALQTKLGVTQSVFTSNRVLSADSGGAIELVGGEVRIMDSRFKRNIATTGLANMGGAIAVGGSEVAPSVLRVSGSEFSSNSAASGGAIGARANAQVLIASSTFEGNGASDGGAIFSFPGSEVSVSESVFRENKAAQSGGAIHSSGSLQVERSLFRHNEAAWNGGGIYAVLESGVHARIQSTTIASNFAGIGGGVAVRNFDGVFDLTNSTVSENLASMDVGGIYFLPPFDILTGSGLLAASTDGFSTPVNRISHSTITENGADDLTGSGVVTFFSEVQLSHTIVYGNGDNVFFADVAVASDTGQPIRAEQSLIGTVAPGTPLLANQTLLGIDPLLRGPIEVAAYPGSVYVLGSSSPAIDAGDSSLQQGGAGLPEFDQRGAPYARVVSGRIDIGAFEVQSAGGELFGDFDEDGDVDGTDFLAWQRGFGTEPNAVAADGDATRNGSVDGNDLGVWQATYGERRSVAPERFAAIDAAVAAEYLDNRTTRENVRGAVARRNAFAEPVVGSRAAAWLPVESSAETDAAEVRSEREQAHEVSDRVELGSVFDDAWADFS